VGGRSHERQTDVRVVLVACVLSLLLFAVLAAAAVYDASWDSHLRQVLLRGTPEIPGHDDAVNRFVAVVGAFLAAAYVGFFVLRKRPDAALLWVLAIAGALALDLLLKRAIQRPSLNPSSSGHSFPSGNAMLSMAVVMASVLTAPKRLQLPLIGAGALFLVAFGGFTVESQAHYPSDVVAGWCVSFSWTAGLWLLLVTSASCRRPPRSA
jgi:membrane-associated phospholipid phosphatase